MLYLQTGEQIHVSLPLSQQVSNESRLSMSESVSEFFDAQEVLLSASSSENEASDDESYISDVSDNISEDNTSVADNISRQSILCFKLWEITLVMFMYQNYCMSIQDQLS